MPASCVKSNHLPIFINFSNLKKHVKSGQLLNNVIATKWSFDKSLLKAFTKANEPKLMKVAKNNVTMKAMKTQTPKPFMESKRVREWVLHEVEAYFETQVIITNANWLKMTQPLFWGHALKWWTMQKDVELNLMGFLPWNDFKAMLNEVFAHTTKFSNMYKSY